MATATAFSRFLVHFRGNLRTAIIVVAVVALGLGIYAVGKDEAVQWIYILLIAAAMLGSAILNALFDTWRGK